MPVDRIERQVADEIHHGVAHRLIVQVAHQIRVPPAAQGGGEVKPFRGEQGEVLG